MNIGILMRDAERTNDPSHILLTLWSLDHDPFQVEGISQALEKAKHSAPNDDRVWLALTDLATRTGRFDEADRWLKRCEQARPDDQSVWKARLEWAKAADRPDELARAASHLPASSFTRARTLELQSWMAARNGDQKTERAALEELLRLEPADLNAVERLADLAAQTGDKERLTTLRRRKAELENAIDHYRQLINHPELVPLAAELARAAEPIGRRYDARLWWQIAARRNLRSSKRRRPRRHGWPRLSHLRWQADFHWRTFWGRFVHGQKKTESLPAFRTYPLL